MSCLSYISEYGSDSEGSESEPDTIKLPNTVRSKLPLPSLDGVRTVREDSHEDDPQQHNGRLRRFPHVRGNWATFVFVQYPEDTSLNALIEKIKFASKPSGIIEQVEDLHVSLSRTVVLKYHMISTFNKSLKLALLPVPSFYLELDGIKVYCNDDKSRTFIALKVDHLSSRHLLQIMKKVDNVLKEFQLPEFYKDPSFHLSVLWTLGDKVEELELALKDLSFKIEEPIFVDKVKSKIGNKYYQYLLD